MTKTLVINPGEKPTEEKLREVEEAKNILLFLMKIVRNYLLL